MIGSRQHSSKAGVIISTCLDVRRTDSTADSTTVLIDSGSGDLDNSLLLCAVRYVLHDPSIIILTASSLPNHPQSPSLTNNHTHCHTNHGPKPRPGPAPLRSNLDQDPITVPSPHPPASYRRFQISISRFFDPTPQHLDIYRFLLRLTLPTYILRRWGIVPFEVFGALRKPDQRSCRVAYLPAYGAPASPREARTNDG